MQSTLNAESVRVGHEKYMKNFCWETPILRDRLEGLSLGER